MFRKDEVIGAECVFSTYIANRDLNTDVLVVKENVFLKDGRVVPNVRLIKDREWPFYITRKGFRNHQSHKESEHMDRLEKRMSRRIDLVRKVNSAFSGEFFCRTMRDIGKIPYLYGTDVLPESLIKHEYNTRWPDCKTSEKVVAGLDNEADIVDGTKEITISNITMKGKTYTAVTEAYVRNTPDFIEKCKVSAQKLAKERFDQYDWELEIVASPGKAVKAVIDKAHEWKPDFISIWNITYDIPEMMDALMKEHYDLAEVFSDPSVPPHFRHFEWVPGKPTKTNRNGVTTSVHIADRWHTVHCPASFYFIDAMCLYKRLRVADGNLPKYSLDYILELNKVDSKLKIAELEHLEKDGTLWHQTMQREYRVEYCVYNAVDDFCLLDLDNATGDIKRSFSIMAGVTPFYQFNRNPKRIADDLHFFYLENFNHVVGSSDPDMADDPHDEHVVGMDNWVKTLASHLINAGMRLINDAPSVMSMVYRYLSDLDIEGTYPNEQVAGNISKETTKIETCSIEGFTEEDMRRLSINLSGGSSNAIPIAVKYFGFPSPNQLREAYKRDRKN